MSALTAPPVVADAVASRRDENRVLRLSLCEHAGALATPAETVVFDWLARAGTDEVLFRNERGEITEGARSNVFVRRGGILLTPPLECGVLNGCLRAELIDRTLAREERLTVKDLDGEVFLGNSLRGLIPARPA